MNICVPTQTDSGLDAPVSGHFGRAPYFAFVDSKTKAVNFVPNADTGHDHGRCVGAALAVKNHPEAVLSSGMGHGAFNLLRARGARIYRTTAVTLAEAIDGFNEGRTPELSSSEDVHHAGAHHGTQGAHHHHGDECCGGGPHHEGSR